MRKLSPRLHVIKGTFVRRNASHHCLLFYWNSCKLQLFMKEVAENEEIHSMLYWSGHLHRVFCQDELLLILNWAIAVKSQF